MCWSLPRSMRWSIVSKAAERSKNVRRETLPESSARRMSFAILRRSVSVLWCVCVGKLTEKDRRAYV